jgi:hypothetical protein
MKNCAQITKVKTGFRVKYYGKNGEMISNSEVLKTRANCNKNIVAHIRLSHGRFMNVIDNSQGKEKKLVYLESGEIQNV